jgi:hypothetical protein
LSAPPLDEQELVGVAAQPLALVVHELDACHRRAGGVDVATDPQRVEHSPPVRRQVEEGTGLVRGAGLAPEDHRLHARPA